MSVRRVYAEKKKGFRGAAESLAHEVRNYLGIPELKEIRIRSVTMSRISATRCSGKPRGVSSQSRLLTISRRKLSLWRMTRGVCSRVSAGAVRSESGFCRGLRETSRRERRCPDPHTTVYVCKGDLSDAEIGRIESYVINPVDSRLASLDKADTLKRQYEQPADVRVFDHFRSLNEEQLRSLYESLNLAMTFRDFQFIQTYYLQEAHRDPTVTEIRVLDTYWSDHCRHTTFATELRTISIEDGRYKKPIEDTLRQYLSDRKTVYGDRKDKYVCLMDLATMGARILKKEGRLTDQEDTDEINACPSWFRSKSMGKPRSGL